MLLERNDFNASILSTFQEVNDKDGDVDDKVKSSLKIDRSAVKLILASSVLMLIVTVPLLSLGSRSTCYYTSKSTFPLVHSS